eukprot:Seg4002.5 transcript_id=Seg4002.5/GoldUCD/mRNA.D3Y31 product="Counting factor associated protein D" protein_id=Seg4002.5/GoldUCD/D3Y31
MFKQQESTGKVDILEKGRKQHGKWRTRQKLIFVIVLVAGPLLLYLYALAMGRAPGSPSLRMKRDLMKHEKLKHDKSKTEVFSFPDEYHAIGVLQLPYGNIAEPFEAWYSAKNKMSRIDYYGGMDVIYHREDIGEYGFAAKIVPEFSEKDQTTFRGCLHKVGNKHYPIRIQSIVPHFKFFKFVGNSTLNGTKCEVWYHSFSIMNKRNKYTLYTTRTRPRLPIKYEMMGYDTLLTSYYDHYILDYKLFEPWKFDFAKFEIPEDLKCFDFPHVDSVPESMASFSPMAEFIPHQLDPSTEAQQGLSPEELSPEELPGGKGNNKRINKEKKETNKMQHYEHIVEELFFSFKESFQKDYKSPNEHEKRKNIFRHNMRFINSHNRRHLGYSLKMNKFADMTEKEVNQYTGLLDEPDGTYNGGKRFKIPNIDFANTPIPKSLDWREFGAVSKIRSQGICGSCYAYAVTSAIESAYYLKTGDLINLSQQQIVDCTWGFGNRGCKGGYPYRALQWLIKHGGLATEESYGKYLAQEGYCHFKNVTVGAGIESYMNITSGNSTELKLALAMYGPVTVLINTRPKTFKFYSSGVYYDETCDDKVDHAAVAIGFGEENGKEYWLIKNSWSASWGRQGFLKIWTKNDNCGVTKKAVVVKVKV